LLKELKGEATTCSDDPWDQNNEFGDFMPKKETPPLEDWPFMEIEIAYDHLITEEQMKDYKDLKMANDMAKAFFLASRWKESNEERRHLGYNLNDQIEDVANMNSVVLGYRALVEQLKRTQLWLRRDEREEHISEPSDAHRLNLLRCSGLLGQTRGSAIALWWPRSDKDRAQVDVCLGDDCMNHGTYAEEMMLRHLCKEVRALGLSKLWVRTRRTESGKIWVPPSLEKLGFKKVPEEEMEKEVWEKFSIYRENTDVQEAVPGFKTFLTGRQCAKYEEPGNQWCIDMGAADMDEVIENREDLAEYLEQHGLTETEKQALLQE